MLVFARCPDPLTNAFSQHVGCATIQDHCACVFRHSAQACQSLNCSPSVPKSSRERTAVNTLHPVHPDNQLHESLAPSLAVRSGNATASAPRVLIVDDNTMNIALAEAVIQDEGFEIATACDGNEAMHQAAVFQPDLILMDIQMPGMDGFDVTRALKADPSTRHIRIAAFSASASQGDEAKMRAAGCIGYLSKPIDIKNFASQIRGLL